MTDPKVLKIEDFSYTLPEEKIAFYPVENRDASKLLIYAKGRIAMDIYRNIADHVPGNALMFFNNTKVVEARLLFTKPTGGVIEIFCLEPHESYADITTAMKQTGSVKWLCLIGGASKWKHGQVPELKMVHESGEIILRANYLEKRSDCFVIELSWMNPALSFAEILHYAGQMPLPPYIKRKAEAADLDRYQTVYAKYNGSVAAPTAGLHFTETILNDLAQKHIRTEFLTLHVGAGTFKPVKAATMAGHEMHAEFIEIRKEVIENLLASIGNSVVAVGTTSLRTLESLYWLGYKLHQNPTIFDDEIPYVSQWEVYGGDITPLPPATALQALLNYLKNKNAGKLIAKTQILIAPGYDFKIVQGLVTNFHQPASTLLLLVSAFIGEGWKRVYTYALKNNFRFLSYGDGSLLWRK